MQILILINQSFKIKEKSHFYYLFFLLKKIKKKTKTQKSLNKIINFICIIPAVLFGFFSTTNFSTSECEY